jgi:hypothetical protein
LAPEEGGRGQDASCSGGLKLISVSYRWRPFVRVLIRMSLIREFIHKMVIKLKPSKEEFLVYKSNNSHLVPRKFNYGQ